MSNLAKDLATATALDDSGVFVLGPGPTTAFEWRAKVTGELPKLTELLAALPRT